MITYWVFHRWVLLLCIMGRADMKSSFMGICQNKTIDDKWALGPSKVDGWNANHDSRIRESNKDLPVPKFRCFQILDKYYSAHIFSTDHSQQMNSRVY